MRLLTALVGLLFLASSGPGIAAAVGEACDSIGGIQCDEALWCEHKEGQCKVADAAGTCIKVPEICKQDYDPVCGCDGETYGNDCMRKMAKVQLDHLGECTQ